jgi:hypothetical protein
MNGVAGVIHDCFILSAKSYFWVFVRIVSVAWQHLIRPDSAQQYRVAPTPHGWSRLVSGRKARPN